MPVHKRTRMAAVMKSCRESVKCGHEANSMCLRRVSLTARVRRKLQTNIFVLLCPVLTRVAEWQLRSWNDSIIILSFQTPGMEWEWNDGTSLVDGTEMEWEHKILE